ncbi:MAG: amidophosphoribosyltransferase [Pseudomonadales bacterium]
MIGIIGPKEVPGTNFTDELVASTSHIKSRVPCWAAYEAYRGLLTLQHRGQDAAGVLSFDSQRQKFYQKKELGLVAQVFDQENIESLVGNMAVGHTRYATVGGDGENDLQPLVTGFPFGVGMVHNGNLVNYHSLVDHLNKNLHQQLLTNNDLEVLLNLWCHSILSQRGSEHGPFLFEHCVKAAKSIFDVANGAYAVVGLMAGAGLFGFRDPGGIRPLVMGRRERAGQPGVYDYCLTSETLALNFLDYTYVRDIAPGEVVLINEQGEVFSEVVVDRPRKSHCMFEWVYFAGAESSIEGKSVYGTRLNLGAVLSKKIKKLIDNSSIKPDFVCPVPDTSRTSAIALAETLGVPYREGLIKNRYIQRSFILDTQEKREKAVELKLSPVKSEIAGKNILLVDDSVVRGTTSKKIIDLLKRHGANEVTLAITCPPLRHGCFYGIDFPAEEQLIANGRSTEEIAEWVGANQVIYLDEEDLVDAIGINDLCMACINGKYPTCTSEAQEFQRRRHEHK